MATTISIPLRKSNTTQSEKQELHEMKTLCFITACHLWFAEGLKCSLSQGAQKRQGMFLHWTWNQPWVSVGADEQGAERQTEGAIRGFHLGHSEGEGPEWVGGVKASGFLLVLNIEPCGWSEFCVPSDPHTRLPLIYLKMGNYVSQCANALGQSEWSPLSGFHVSWPAGYSCLLSYKKVFGKGQIRFAWS